ncbi:ATP-binding cassette sub-family C member 4-like isoform X3 [Mytilus edulis]|uniref:ATP-binding cassette sub-family C member 4-like isoform X3 n=1 Tax=Mytilus edulis TaxID=6550 RepID=UPI0039EFBC1F
MDETLKHYNPNPTLTTNPISKLFFWWLNPLFKIGYQRRLEVDDMYNVCEQDSSDNLGDRLEKEWNKELRKKQSGGKPSLLKCLIRMFGVEYALLGLILFIEEGTKIAQPLLLGQLIRYFTPGSTVSSTDAYMYAMGVSLCAIILAIFHHPYFFGVQRIGMQLRVACCSLLYRKALRLNNTALGQTTTGQIVNLMSNDVNRFDTAAIFLHYLWVGPAQAIPVLIILWNELGPSAMAGFGVLLLLVPVQSWMGKLFSKFRHKTAVHTDERVKVMNEIISGMRVIKMYCWEKPFGQLVEKIRGTEVKQLLQRSYIEALFEGFFFTCAKVIILFTLITYALVGGAMTAKKVFLTVVLIQTIRLPMTLFVPLAFRFSLEALVTFRRLKKFLLLDELKKESHLERADSVEPGDCYISINNITGKWDPESEQTTLKDINANVQRGKLLAVIGPVGAGKSSLLMSVLGEIPLVNGDVKVHGRISYVAQQPWVFSASVRQNIVFGNKYEQSKYNRILKACALNKDIELMPNGDATLIGDRGVSLSGGQRARVSLARALYIDADVYLLDDPLSAVDAAVSRHLFEKVVLGVLKNKPVILVTHQLQFLKEADEILILKEGKCLGQGTFDEMSQSGIDFSSLLKRDKEEEEVKVEEHHQEVSYHIENTKLANIGSMMSLTSIGTEFEPDPVQLPEEEERQEGTVGWKVYYEWLKNGCGPFKFIILILLNLLTQGLYVTSDWWLALWSNKEENKHAAIALDKELRFQGYNVTNVTIPFVDTHENVYIFTGIIAAVFLFGLLRALMFFKVAVDSSMHMHNKMFNSLLRSPISFFDTNPVGRILNRFSKDTGHMDDLLPITLFDFIQCFLLIIGIVVVVGIVLPWVFIPLIPIGILFVVVRRYYIMTSRHIKRLEGTTRSPVFSHLSASLQGLHTIRAFGVQDKFQEEFDNHQNLHTEAWFLFLATSRWLAVRLDWMCAVFVTIVAFLCVVLADSLDAGRVGLTLTYAMTLMGMFQWAVRQSAEVENQMISVERVMQYSKLPSEADLTSDKDHKPPPDWPVHGKITGDKVCLRYSSTGPMVLKYLKFSIESKEKIGIVGRTGAGKSSLIAMLFRMIEPEGQVMIDGVNIVNIGLHELRNKISIIPQDPVLFTGPLRKNLDPFGEHADSSLWSALEEVQLKPAIEELPSQLETEVSEGGINFSVGQRQLICLARAILRKNKILMIDEATANVDPRTDALIQNTIREKFRYCTVLTIAHRLNTIMDSDKVLVLDEGNIMEFDHPYLLLQIEDGYFSKMVQQTGPSEAEHLLSIAKDTYDSSGKEVERVVSTSDVNIDESMCMQEDRSKGASMEVNGNAVMIKDFGKTELNGGLNVEQKGDQAKSDSNQNLSIDSNSVIEQKSNELTEAADNENSSIQHSNESENSPLLKQSHDHKKSHDTAKKSPDTVNNANLANGFHSDSEEAKETEHLINHDDKKSD